MFEPTAHPLSQPPAKDLRDNLRQSLETIWTSVIEASELSSIQGKILIRSILEAYSSPDRRFHNLTHLADMANELETVRGKLTDPHATFLALFYHDLSRNGRVETDVHENTHRARCELVRLGASTELLDATTAIVLDCRSGQSDDCCDDARHIINADRAILSRDSAQYAEYAKALRAEHSRLKDPQYAEQRTRVLSKLKEQPTIYSFDPVDSERNVRARLNIARELTMLADVRPATGFDWQGLASGRL